MKNCFLLGCLVFSAAVSATPGGVDRNGCHESKSDGYHCHKVAIEKIKHSYADENQAQRSKRLKAQCQGLPNQGICFGYSDRQPVGYSK